MLDSFWSGLGEELAKHWVARILTPALAFWIGGLGAVWWHEHGDAVRADGWTSELKRTVEPIENLPALPQVVLVVAALMAVAVSALAAERLTFPLLRLLEGYWPARLRGRLRSRCWEAAVQKRKDRDTLALRQRRGELDVPEYAELRRLEVDPGAHPERLEELRRRQVSGFTAADAAELSHLRAELRYAPRDEVLTMPTRLGNILRASERRPLEKYGLDTVVCWVPLWLVLPTETKTEVVEARSRLDGALRTWLWGAIFVVWTPWTLWAIPVAVAVPAVTYYAGILPAARLFGDLIGTAFDLHRMQLYDSLHLPRPASPAAERRCGARVTNLLWGGLDGPAQYTGRPAGE